MTAAALALAVASGCAGLGAGLLLGGRAQTRRVGHLATALDRTRQDLARAYAALDGPPAGQTVRLPPDRPWWPWDDDETGDGP